jgi:16S rRNA (guanine966-N2)-methyltransferase
MRIIAGEFGGRRLETPPDERTRPMLEQSRAAVFSMLGDAVDGARMLDLYSGTGSLGLEALSRGAVFVRFAERDPVARGCLKRNVEALGVSQRAEIEAATAERVIAAAPSHGYSIISMDPPYREYTDLERRGAMFSLIREAHDRVLAPGGYIVLHFPDRSLTKEHFADYELFRFRNYGRNAIAILHKKENEIL